MKEMKNRVSSLTTRNHEEQDIEPVTLWLAAGRSIDLYVSVNIDLSRMGPKQDISYSVQLLISIETQLA